MLPRSDEGILVRNFRLCKDPQSLDSSAAPTGVAETDSAKPKDTLGVAL